MQRFEDDSRSFQEVSKDELQQTDQFVVFFTLLPSLKLRQGRSGNPRIPHFLRCQGFAVCDYSFTLDALDL
jgi:hypothetical protein